jgi:tripartite-type tricarboxylate transporter receptor subunit TctC
MSLPRSIRHLAVPALLALAASTAYAQTFPDRTIRIIDAFPPGGAADYLARVIGPRITANLGRQIVVENRPGAGGTLGATVAAKSPPDGYTLLMGSLTGITASVSLYAKLSYDPLKDLAPVGRVGSGMNVLATHPSLPVKTVKELVALAKARPGDLKYGSGGVGSGNHLSAELFKSVTGANMQHVAYKGAPPAVTAVMAGEVELGFMSTTSALGQINAGRLRPIAVTGTTRDVALPQIPTVREAGYPDYEVFLHFGLFAPTGTPREIITLLNAEVGKALAQADVKERFAAQGFAPTPSTPEELAAMMRSEVDKWAKVIKTAGIKAD